MQLTDTPLHLEDERFFMGLSVGEGLEMSSLTGTKGKYLAERTGKDGLYGIEDVLTASFMLNESLFPCQLAYSVY